MFPRNAMGSHTDPDPEARNEDNSCFCMEEEGFPCFKSGVRQNVTDLVFASTSAHNFLLFSQPFPQLLYSLGDEHGALQENAWFAHRSSHSTLVSPLLPGMLVLMHLYLSKHCSWCFLFFFLLFHLSTPAPQADQSFRDAVEGMKPEKEKHQVNNNLKWQIFTPAFSFSWTSPQSLAFLWPSDRGNLLSLGLPPLSLT